MKQVRLIVITLTLALSLTAHAATNIHDKTLLKEKKLLETMNKKLDHMQHSTSPNSKAYLQQLSAKELKRYWPSTTAALRTTEGFDLKASPVVYINGLVNAFVFSDNQKKSMAVYHSYPITPVNSGIHLNNASLNLIAKPTHWLTMVFNTSTQSLPYTGTFSPTGSQSPALKHNRYFVTIGEKQYPIYAFAGQKAVTVGQFINNSQINMPLTQQYFQAGGSQVGIGWHEGGFDSSVSMVRSNGQYNIIISPGKPEDLSTFAAAIKYHWHFLHAGIGYIARSFYFQAATPDLASDKRKSAPAEYVSLGLDLSHLSLYAEYINTTTHAELSIAHHDLASTKPLRAWDVGTSYRVNSSVSMKILRWLNHSKFYTDYSQLDFDDNINAEHWDSTSSDFHRFNIGWSKKLTANFSAELDYINNSAPEYNSSLNDYSQDLYVAGITAIF